MGKRHNIDNIKKWTEENSDVKCISDDYIDNKTELTFECNEGHIFYKTINNFKKRSNCPYCTGRYKYTFDDVKNNIELVNGYKLLSTDSEYNNCKTKLFIQCDQGHEFPMSFDEFKNGGHRCPICNTGGNFKYSLEIAKKIFEDNNCILEAIEYINCDIPMDYICECGNHSTISLKMFQSGQRCYECGNKKIGNALRIPYDEIIDLFKSNGCKLLSSKEEYLNSKTKIRYVCSCGNEDEVTVEKFKIGERCNKCKQERIQNTFLLKYGVKYPFQNKEIKEKIRKTLYQNGTAPCSNQQRYIYNLIGGELNYPVKTLSLDIAFPEEMLYLEYDGGLHKGQVIFGNITEKEFNKRERNRTYGLYRSGWKEIRIISCQDYLPFDSKLLELINYAKRYLSTGHHYIKFDIDNSKIINSQGEIDYDFGKLRKIKSTDIKEVI